MATRKPVLGCAVIPAAGLGTRMLPITKSVPKEMLPVGTKPMIQYSVEEAIKAGIKRICLIINERKEIIRDYFLGKSTEKLKGRSEIEALDNLSKSAELTFIYQHEPKGVADAIYKAKEFVGEDPFALLLPDNVFFSSTPAIAQLFPIFDEYKMDVTACIKITQTNASLFGNCGRIDYELMREGLFKITGLDDKKKGLFSLGKSDSAVREVPRRIFTPHVFDYIERLKKGIHGEFDDVPLFQYMVRKGEILGVLLDGEAFDLGNPNGYRAANSYLGQDSWNL